MVTSVLYAKTAAGSLSRVALRTVRDAWRSDNQDVSAGRELREQWSPLEPVSEAPAPQSNGCAYMCGDALDEMFLHDMVRLEPVTCVDAGR